MAPGLGACGSGEATRDLSSLRPSAGPTCAARPPSQSADITAPTVRSLNCSSVKAGARLHLSLGP